MRLTSASGVGHLGPPCDTEHGADLLGGAVERGTVRIGVGKREVEIGLTRDGDGVQVYVRHFQPRDDQPDPFAREGLALRLADGLGDLHEVRRKVGLEVEPIVDFDTGHDQCVSRPDGIDREEGDGVRVAPHETPGELAVDDPSEQGRHVEVSSSPHRQTAVSPRLRNVPAAATVASDPPSHNRGLWTIPNLISIIRLACLPLFVYLLFGAENRAAAAWLLAVLGITDWCDGYIARHFNQVSEIGKILDPVADRLLFFVGLGAILADGSIPVVIGVAILAREFVVGAATVVVGLLGGRRIDVTWFGKAGTFANMVAVPAFLGSHSTLSYARQLGWLAWIAVVPGLVFSYIAAALYVPIARRALVDASSLHPPKPVFQ